MDKKLSIRLSPPYCHNLKSKACGESRRTIQNLKFGILIGAIVFAVSFPAAAQQPASRIPRIGKLDFRSTDLKAFRQGLHELGYEEGRNIAIEYRSAEEDLDRLAPLAAELVHLKVDVIVTGTGQATLRAKKATDTIPIVMTGSADAVRQGIVASLGRPGGNVTGLTATSIALNAKRLEVLKEGFPGVSRVGALECRGFPGASGLDTGTLKESQIVSHPTVVDRIARRLRIEGSERRGMTGLRLGGKASAGPRAIVGNSRRSRAFDRGAETAGPMCVRGIPPGARSPAEGYAPPPR